MVQCESKCMSSRSHCRVLGWCHWLLLMTLCKGERAWLDQCSTSFTRQPAIFITPLLFGDICNILTKCLFFIIAKCVKLCYRMISYPLDYMFGMGALFTNYFGHSLMTLFTTIQNNSKWKFEITCEALATLQKQNTWNNKLSSAWDVALFSHILNIQNNRGCYCYLLNVSLGVMTIMVSPSEVWLWRKQFQFCGEQGLKVTQFHYCVWLKLFCLHTK